MDNDNNLGNLVIEDAQPQDGCRFEGTTYADSKRIAILAFHGMGQQVCHETLDTIATSICHQARRSHSWRIADNPRVRVAQLGDQRLGRVEMRLRNNESEREVHVYEAYWAPLTRGHIRLTETVGFLFRSGLNGMRHWAAEKGCFTWRVFADNRKDAPVQVERVSSRVPFVLAIALSLIGLLFFLGISVLTFAAAWILHVAGAPPTLCHDIAAAVTLFGIIVALLIGAVVGIGSTAVFRDVFSFLGKYYRQITLGFYIPLAIWLCWFAANQKNSIEHIFMTLSSSIGAAVDSRWGVICLAFAPLVLYAWTRLRYFLVEFIGDVAIYVSADHLNNFWEVREKIRGLCCKIITSVYQATDGVGNLAYDEIIILGHSLGSVVAYHALNTLVTVDALRLGPTLSPAKRTSLFLTLGSPLDKVTYLFRVQAKSKKEHYGESSSSDGLSDNFSFRDAVDGTFAPLASCSQTRRQIPWKNIWSGADKISGRLSYFDPIKVNWRASDPPIVLNEEDEEGKRWDPVAAHTGYWSRRKFGGVLFDAIVNGKGGGTGTTNEGSVATAKTVGPQTISALR